MTEKSEDQVVYVCELCESYASPLGCYCLESLPKPTAFIPHSKYLALKADLGLAVEALKEIESHVNYAYEKNINMYGAIKLAAKEALGKIGKK